MIVGVGREKPSLKLSKVISPSPQVDPVMGGGFLGCADSAGEDLCASHFHQKVLISGYRALQWVVHLLTTPHYGARGGLVSCIEFHTDSTVQPLLGHFSAVYIPHEGLGLLLPHKALWQCAGWTPVVLHVYGALDCLA